MSEPRTPAELKGAFKSLIKQDDKHYALLLVAIDELVDKLESAYRREAELSALELLFGKILLEEYLKTR